MHDDPTEDWYNTLQSCFHIASANAWIGTMGLLELFGLDSPASLSDTKLNNGRQLQCRGCDEIEELLAWLRNRKVDCPSYEGMLVSGPIHRNFKELDTCASVQGCVACQVLRRAFLLEQITQQGVDELYATAEGTYIYAKLYCTAKKVFLEAIIGSKKVEAKKSAWILCSEEPHETTMELAAAPVRFDDIFTNLKPHVLECYKTHHCSNLKYSSANPSWLVELMPGDMARLVSPTDSESVSYVALSYSWGVPNGRKEEAILERTSKLAADPNTFVHKLFARELLPQTLQDAMKITEAFDQRFIWIDRLCIPKGADWDAESAKMHEVFGNAYFTLAATGAERAWDSLKKGRQAWAYYPRRCNLDAYWLSTIDMDLNDMRVQAPLSKRGWVLQEERLSPRVLYWCAQRAYWSCAHCSSPYIEGSQGLCNDRASDLWSDPQAFLKHCYRGDSEGLETDWLDIVASYVRRELYRDVDRFLAISGLATRYLEAKRTMKHTDEKEEYLSGLWRGSLARGLSWSVAGCMASHRLDHIAPSWSWASLPLCTEIDFGTQFQESPSFQLISTTLRTKAEDSMSVVECGADVRAILVQGRCRKFVGEGAIKLPWDGVCTRRGARDQFDFSKMPQQSAYARDAKSGRVLMYEARRKAVVGQLDYAIKWSGSIAEGREADILALEIGQSSMSLLLHEYTEKDNVLRCTRVGVANGYRKDFFSGCAIQRVRLI